MGGITNYGYYNVISWKKNAQLKHYPTNIMSFEFGNQEDDYLLFLKLENDYIIPNIDNLITSLESLYNENNNTFVVLIPRKSPPAVTATEEEFVFSFSCQIRFFKILVASLNHKEFLSTELLFELLDQVTTSTVGIEKLLIRQFPFESNKALPVPQCDVIVPHRGDDQYLRGLLYFLDQMEGTTVYVGLDQHISHETLLLIKEYYKMFYFNFIPNPVGPYVIRNRLIDQGSSNTIFFQDSDDIPCADRFQQITAYMMNNHCELCGSHELKMDYYTRTVRAVRFPLDVTAALSVAPWYPMLHPASAITRKSFFKCGKLSEERMFANDSKFLLNSFFIINRIQNINEFLYIRKRHPGSLTTSPNTMLGSEERQKLLDTWNYDFERVKSGKLALSDSTLIYKSSTLKFKVARLQ